MSKSSMSVICPTCNGAKVVMERKASKRGESVSTKMCPQCQGAGWIAPP
jgi:DnaJ-class molecular chaperone